MKAIVLMALALIAGSGPSAAAPIPLHSGPRPTASVVFEDDQGRERSLADFTGKVVVLNLWATWCAPCRKEMPTLDRLQGILGGPDFAVLALSIDRGGRRAVEAFYMENDIRQLDIYVGHTKIAQELGALGLPTTLLLDRQGRELGRLVGPAEWDSAEMVAFLKSQVDRRTGTQVPASGVHAQFPITAGQAETPSISVLANSILLAVMAAWPVRSLALFDAPG